MWWPALGGIAVGIGGWLEPRALGVGYDVIGDLLNHRLLVEAALALLGVKALIWVIALGSGTSGGVLAPLLMMGAGLGTVLAAWLPGGDAALWPLVCMAAVLSGVLGAPLTATVFAYGLTGAGDALLPLLAACAVSHGVNVLFMRRSIMTERIARRGRHVHREYAVDPQERMRVADVMTRDVLSVPAATPLAEVADHWFGARQRHRAFPVVDAQGSLLGMIDRDLLSLAGAHADAGALARSATVPVVLPDETCRVAAERMAAHGLERLPVVADRLSRRLAGIVSRSDLIKPVQAQVEEEGTRERLRGWRA
jgi:CBS domain-containing protein